MVKALSPEVLHEVVHGCLQLHGGSGFMRGHARSSGWCAMPRADHRWRRTEVMLEEGCEADVSYLSRRERSGRLGDPGEGLQFNDGP
jgi:alkylation response protein AidB-like acyl-CoA dehydrogenase